MEVYRKQTQKILKRFLDREIAFPECVAALDHALYKLIPKMRAEDLLAIRALVLANNETVMKEMEKRQKQRKAHARHRAKKRPASN
jgi:hypothetical protein